MRLKALISFNLALSLLKAVDPITVSLSAHQMQLAVLPVGTSSATLSFSVDDCRSLAFDTMSTASDLSVRLVGPNGESFTAASETNFSKFQGTGSDVPFTLDGVTHYVYSLSSLGPGFYRVLVDRSNSVDSDLPVVTVAALDSSLKAAVLTGVGPNVSGRSQYVTVALFDGTAPITQARIEAYVKTPSGTVLSVSLHDDGQAPDEKQGDGLYSGLFIGIESGSYSIGAAVTGTSLNGLSFTRDVATSISISSPSATLNGSIKDSAFDLDGDGIYDGINFSVGVDVQTAGQFMVNINLKTPSGAIVSGSQLATLETGMQKVQVKVMRPALFRGGEDGSYSVSRVQLIEVGEQSHMEIDRRENIAETSSYRLANFGLSKQLPGDVDLDGTVACSDLFLVQNALGHRIGDALYDGRADMNHDKVIDVRDLASVAQHLPAGTKCSR